MAQYLFVYSATYVVVVVVVVVVVGGGGGCDAFSSARDCNLTASQCVQLL